jgi:hypothetical protein
MCLPTLNAQIPSQPQSAPAVPTFGKWAGTDITESFHSPDYSERPWLRTCDEAIDPIITAGRICRLRMYVCHSRRFIGGNHSSFSRLLPVLGPGLFIVWLPTVLLMNRMTRDFKQKDVWRAALRGCPKWMQRLVYVLLATLAWAFFCCLCCSEAEWHWKPTRRVSFQRYFYLSTLVPRPFSSQH